MEKGRIYISNLPIKVSRGSLTRYFNVVGKVYSIHLCKGRNAGCAFITMDNHKTSIDIFDGNTFKNRTIKVSESVGKKWNSNNQEEEMGSTKPSQQL